MRKPFSKRQRFAIFNRDGFTCMYCGKKPPEVILHVDHIIPVIEGGGNEDDNLVTACSDCNLGKGRRQLEQVPSPVLHSAVQRSERLAQMRAIAEAAAAEREALEVAAKAVSDAWMSAEGIPLDEMELIPDDMNSVKRFLKQLPLEEVLNAVEVTFRNCGCHQDDYKFRYFCGVCWHKINGTYIA